MLKFDNEPNTKSLQDAVIQACLVVEVIPQGPLGTDHMANGRVEMAVREVQRQCRTLRISAEQNKSVRIADDSPPLSWLPLLTEQVVNKMGTGKEHVETTSGLGLLCEEVGCSNEWKRESLLH